MTEPGEPARAGALGLEELLDVARDQPHLLAPAQHRVEAVGHGEHHGQHQGRAAGGDSPRQQRGGGDARDHPAQLRRPLGIAAAAHEGLVFHPFVVFEHRHRDHPFSIVMDRPGGPCGPHGGAAGATTHADIGRFVRLLELPECVPPC